jgi:prepilin-type N-terminal cleavage/methylation domain-containing protein
MRHTEPILHSGFTIVELLVVIVVIGILAALALVSYSGISGRASVASLQSDLSSSTQQLKMYYTDNGAYPKNLNGSNCPVRVDDTVDTRYCLKASSGNLFSYSSSSPYSSFKLCSSSGSDLYRATESSAPVNAVTSTILTTGGSITNSCTTRSHAFAAGNYSNLPVNVSGTISVTIKGAGGGGGGGQGMTSGANGGTGGGSSVTYGGTTYTAGGGGGGERAYLYVDCFGEGSPGGTSGNPGWSSAGVGSGGGASGLGYEANGCPGGVGGQLTGTLSVVAGQTISIVVGNGGAGGGGGNSAGDGGTGNPGSVVLSYSY